MVLLRDKLQSLEQSGITNEVKIPRVSLMFQVVATDSVAKCHKCDYVCWSQVGI